MKNSRRTILTKSLKLGATALAATLSAPWIATSRAAGRKPTIVVELFTSQGCSSCPPAEDFLGDLAQRDDIIALEFHVDYWDYIGWEDPFADPAFTQRQRKYNTAFGSPYNYTPQMVIDGRAHEVGSRRSAVDARIEAASMKRMMSEQSTTPPSLTVEHASNGGFTVQLNGMPVEDGSYDILLVGFDDVHVTDVKQGENRGRRLQNAQVVRAITPIGTGWTGGPLDIQVAADQLKGNNGCAILVQNPDTGTIAAAEKMAY